MATTLRMTDDHIERAQLYYKLALEACCLAYSMAKRQGLRVLMSRSY